MKIYSIIRSIKAEKNASHQQKGLQTSPLLSPPFPPLLLPPREKIDVSPLWILPQPWLIWFYHQDHSSHWFCAETIFQSFILLAPRTGSPPVPSRWSPFFAEFHFWVLLIVSKGKGTAGWPLICPGEPQEDLGRGQQKCLRRDVRRRVPPLFWVEQNVRAYRRWACWEKLRNKVCSIMHNYCFINTFRVDFSHTSYISFNRILYQVLLPTQYLNFLLTKTTFFLNYLCRHLN